ncbi:Ger(x)C family spore germination protein [Alicyclobacillus sp. SO9]|uniref:Ger(x)C family spore germination protein n=1 Tax=Alicyclobacillus sp. SO9 TaxID=2665646 RepID=UPI0018E770E2|nr:Ger(x)C family spore germination protein [Alicyclobacillus sp. SO9]QQE81031.1 Ger(x)C family spore germination protein [Alicyclobacillus sp. SO9]
MKVGRVLVRKYSSMLVLLITVIVSLGLSGCFDATEVENLNVVAGIGVDLLETNKVRVTLEVFRPIKSGQSSTAETDKRQSFIVSSTGDTIEDALSVLTTRSPRRLYYPHNVLFIFGKSYAENGLDRAFDYLERDRAYRRNSLLLIADNTAAEVLKARFLNPQVTSLGIRQLLDMMNYVSEAYNTEQLTFLRQYLEPAHTSSACVLGLNAMRMPQVRGLGLVKKGKLVTVSKGAELKGLLWMLGETRQVPITVSLKGGHASHEKSTVRLLSTYRNIRWNTSSRLPSVDITVTGRAEVDHVGGCTTLTPTVMRMLETAVDDYMKRHMTVSMAAMQSEGIDGAQLATSLHRVKPRMWRRYASTWDTVYPAIPVTFHVHVSILKTGLAGRPPVGAYSTHGSLPPNK